MSTTPTESEISSESFAEREAQRLADERIALEALEKAKTKPVSFAVRANYAFDPSLCPDDIPSDTHTIAFTAKDFLHIKAPYNSDWWIGRVVRIGCDLGFLPSPSKLNSLRAAFMGGNNQQQMMGPAGMPIPTITLSGAGANKLNDDAPNSPSGNGGVTFAEDVDNDASYDGPLDQFACSRRGIPEEESPDGHFLTEGGDESVECDTPDHVHSAPPAYEKQHSTSTINRPILLNISFGGSSKSPNSLHDGTEQLLGALGAPGKRKARPKKVVLLPPYEVVPCMRPFVFIGPSLKGYEVTDMMQKALFDQLKRRFEGRMFITRVTSDISQAKRLNNPADKKPPTGTEKARNRAAAAHTEVQRDIERIFELASTMQLVVLDCDTINHPNQLAKTSLAPILVYLKINSLKVLQKLIKTRGKSQMKNASVQLTAADKLMQCPPETFDFILDQSNLDVALDRLSEIFEGYWAATHPPSMISKLPPSSQSKVGRLLGMDTGGAGGGGGASQNYLSRTAMRGGQVDAVTAQMLSQLGAAAGANGALSNGSMNNLDHSSTTDLVPDQSIPLWGGEPESYRGDREMRFDHQERTPGTINAMISKPAASAPPVPTAGAPSAHSAPKTPFGGPAPGSGGGIFGLVQAANSRKPGVTVAASGAVRDIKGQAVYASRSARQLKQRQVELQAQQEEMQKAAMKRRHLARKQYKEQQSTGQPSK